MPSPPQEAKPPDAAEVREHLRRVEASSIFSKLKRHKQLLRFVVEKNLRGLHDHLKGPVIAAELFGGNYEEVRLLAGGVRAKLLDYYSSEGSSEPLQIEIPKGAYIPVFKRPPDSPPGRAANHPSDAVQPEVPPLDKQIWNVPARNPFFTARYAYLDALREAFLKNPPAVAQPQAISGLGGIGKSETAVEYAHRYRDHYTAGLWVVADSRDSLLSGFVSIAHLLDLPQRHERDVALAAAAVRSWLEVHTGWLLIFDNAEDLSVVRAFLPAGPGGHCLITTRLHATGSIAESRRLEKLELSEGALLLLRCAKVLASDAVLECASDEERRLAQQICGEVGGLPLALDQAGAFIDETPSTLAEYLALYRLEGSKLRARRGNLRTDTHPSVMATFSLSFEKVAERSPAAAELMRACAFLEPDAIPEELFTGAAKHLGEEFAGLEGHASGFTEVLEVAGRFSLIRRDPVDRSIHIHRLVQEVVQDGMTDDARRVWIERLLQALEQVFPSAIEVSKWQQPDRLLPHARAIVRHARIYKVKVSGNRVRRECGLHLMGRGQHAEAEPLLLEELAACEEDFGPEHAETVRVLNALAVVYRALRRQSEAEAALGRALSILDKIVRPDDSQTTRMLIHFAMTQEIVGLHAEAESTLLRALAIYENCGQHEDAETAVALCALGEFYRRQDRYPEAESSFLRAFAILEKQLGTDHLQTINALFALALVYLDQSRYAEAEVAIQRSLAVREKLLGPDHPDVIQALYQLVVTKRGQGRYSEAEADMLRTLKMAERVYRPGSGALISLQRLAEAWSVQG